MFHLKNLKHNPRHVYPGISPTKLNRQWRAWGGGKCLVPWVGGNDAPCQRPLTLEVRVALGSDSPLLGGAGRPYVPMSGGASPTHSPCRSQQVCRATHPFSEGWGGPEYLCQISLRAPWHDESAGSPCPFLWLYLTRMNDSIWIAMALRAKDAKLDRSTLPEHKFMYLKNSYPIFLLGEICRIRRSVIIGNLLLVYLTEKSLECSCRTPGLPRNQFENHWLEPQQDQLPLSENINKCLSMNNSKVWIRMKETSGKNTAT